MPGVADQVRKTNLKQQHSQRKQDMSEILRLVEEGRLKEADAHQLEVLQLALDLGKKVNPTSEALQPVDTGAITDAVKNAIAEALQNISLNVHGLQGANVPTADPSRPAMRHVSLTDINQVEENVSISHSRTLGEELKSEDQATEKLEKLKKIKGNA